MLQVAVEPLEIDQISGEGIYRSQGTGVSRCEKGGLGATTRGRSIWPNRQIGTAVGGDVSGNNATVGKHIWALLGFVASAKKSLAHERAGRCRYRVGPAGLELANEA